MKYKHAQKRLYFRKKHFTTNARFIIDEYKQTDFAGSLFVTAKLHTLNFYREAISLYIHITVKSIVNRFIIHLKNLD